MYLYYQYGAKSVLIFSTEIHMLQVADFGLTKLTEVVGSISFPTRLVGTFGYMSPE